MRKAIFLLLASVMAFALIGCDSGSGSGSSVSEGAQSETSSVNNVDSTASSGSSDKTKSEKILNASFEVPKNWEKVKVDNNTTFYFPPNSNSYRDTLMVNKCKESAVSSDTEDYLLKEYVSGMLSADGVKSCSKTSCTIDGIKSYKIKYTQKIDGTKYNITGYAIPLCGKGIIYFLFGSDGKSGVSYKQDYESVINSISVKDNTSSGSDNTDTDATANADTSTSDTAAATDTTPANLSGEKASALQKAQEYLDYEAFSKSGLAKQLEYEGFSKDDSKYAANHCGANWKEQAIKKAEEYKSYEAFSHKALVGQLKYEGFAAEQAEYGASHAK